MVLEILCAALSIYSLVLLAHVVLSWALVAGFRPPIDGPLRVIVDTIDALTRPILAPLRGMMPPLRFGGVGLDLSVLAAFLILAVLRRAIGC